MKSARQIAILDIIANRSIETQEELADALRQDGYQVTQATVSRDIKELRLIKELTPDRTYRYATSEHSENKMSDRLTRMLSDTVVSVKGVYNQIVIKTISASASIAAEAIDNFRWPEVLGTIAGENTILLILRSEEETPMIVSRLNKMLLRNQ